MSERQEPYQLPDRDPAEEEERETYSDPDLGGDDEDWEDDDGEWEDDEDEDLGPGEEDEDDWQDDEDED